MGATQTDKESALGKWILITVSILGAALVVALIWALSCALNNSSPQGSVAPTSETATMNTVLSQEEIERQHVMAEQRTAPVIQAPVAAPPAVVPTKQNNDEVILQKEKAKFNQQIVERLKQYVKDNPTRDTRELEKQIKKRENQGAQGR